MNTFIGFLPNAPDWLKRCELIVTTNRSIKGHFLSEALSVCLVGAVQLSGLTCVLPVRLALGRLAHF